MEDLLVRASSVVGSLSSARSSWSHLSPHGIKLGIGSVPVARRSLVNATALPMSPSRGAEDAGQLDGLEAVEATALSLTSYYYFQLVSQ